MRDLFDFIDNVLETLGCTILIIVCTPFGWIGMLIAALIYKGVTD